MNRNISQLEPQIVWKYFQQLTQIPRPSKKEAQVRAYLVAEAQRLGLDYSVSAIGNVVIRKGASDNSATRKKIVLQAHMDMVPAKTKDSTHNFETDPIDAYIDGEWVTANQTTLGADNGMGVAMALAILASNDVQHNDLEILITTDEEAGMSGAFGLVGDEVRGEVLLNLDSEEDDEVCIGCAGGINTNITYPIQRQAPLNGHVSIKIELKDLFSGHSGVDIPLGRANAIKEIAHLLLALQEQCNYQLVSISGGKLRNVIPAYCEAVINLAASDLAQVHSYLQHYEQELRSEFAVSDPKLTLTIGTASAALPAIQPQQAQQFITALASAFNGVWRMNNQLGIAETSSNIGVLATQADQLSVITLQRSALEAPKLKIARSVAAAFQQIGATVEHSDNYPGWQPNTASPTLAVVKKVYQELFGSEIKVGATHGGLECGLIMAKFPQLDATSIGATICFPHSPHEKVNIKSVAKSWRLLKNLIEAL